MVIVMNELWRASGHGWELELTSVDESLDEAQLHLHLDRFWHASEQGCRIEIGADLLASLLAAAKEDDELGAWLRRQLEIGH